MRPHAILSLLLLPMSAAAEAQVGDEFAAYRALSQTPVAALPPVAPVAPADVGRAVMLRYGRLSGDPLQSVALRVEWGGATRTGWTIGGQTCGGCTALLMTGFDAVVPLRGESSDPGRATRVGVALAPALGAAVPVGSFGGGVILAGALSLPMSVEIPVGARARLVPFVAPGIGGGLLLGGSGGSVGARPLLGGGVELTGLGNGRLGLGAGLQKVVVREGEAQLGATITWRPVREGR